MLPTCKENARGKRLRALRARSAHGRIRPPVKSSRRGVSTVLTFALLSAWALAVPPAAPGDTAPLSPQRQQALMAYVRDPSANAKAFLDAARQEQGTLTAGEMVFLGDAALRIGRYRLATEFFEAVRDGDNPVIGSIGEMGMAWAALGRGRLDEAYQHFEAAGAMTPAWGSSMDVLTALVAAANGDPGASAALAAAVARPDVAPELREAGPLLDAYARYWAGDADGAAVAFTAFAVAHPNSRYADDAVYAAAQAKQLAGRDAEAQADLEALAGDRRAHAPLSSRLVALDGRAFLREAMRRDRTMGTRSLQQRIADLLDGDGSRMARAALATRARESIAAATDAGAAPVTRRRTRGRDAATAEDNGAPSPRTTVPGAAAPSQSGPVEGTQFPWAAILTVSALLLALGLWVFGRGRTAQARSR